MGVTTGKLQGSGILFAYAVEPSVHHEESKQLNSQWIDYSKWRGRTESESPGFSLDKMNVD